MGALDELRDDPTSRKRFFRMAGAGAVGGLAVLVAACGSDDDNDAETAAKPPSMADRPDRDVEILNYALTLEYLEADFYRQVIASGAITDRATADLAKQFGDTEQQHVDVLIPTIKKLGGTPAAKPQTTFEDVLAGGPEKILATAATVENVGAAAYLGQAPRIQNKEVLAAALSIHSVEARHAAALNELIGAGFKGSLPGGAFAKPMDMDAVLESVEPFIA
jgi:rubrerythrin